MCHIQFTFHFIYKSYTPSSDHLSGTCESYHFKTIQINPLFEVVEIVTVKRKLNWARNKYIDYNIYIFLKIF